ncbi:aspartate/glutamate racemase family protein [Peptacetobacter hominis]|nr:Asp/Glu/hydantoin racemase [Peptacetobacter hominis]
MKMTAAVIAGTPVDTMMGAQFLEKKGIDAMCFPVSENPIKQTEFQVASESDKKEVIREIIERIKSENIEDIFVYCNSLSASVDMDELAKEENIRIITPMTVYKSEAEGRKKIGVIAANAQGLSGIEKAIVGKNPECIVSGVSFLQAVIDIENGRNPEDIIYDNGINLALDIFKKQGMECMILGCTHFPYFEEKLKNISEIDIINPSEKMYEILINK